MLTDRKVATKVWKAGPDGPEKANFGMAAWFQSEFRPCQNIRELSALLTELEADPFALVIPLRGFQRRSRSFRLFRQFRLVFLVFQCLKGRAIVAGQGLPETPVKAGFIPSTPVNHLI